MMFATLSGEIATRHLAAQRFVSLVEELELSSSPASAICKGLCFVHLYATYEYAVRSAVQATLAELRAAAVKKRTIRKELLSLIFENHWTSAATCGPARLWDKRIDLLAECESMEPLSEISDTLFPSDGSHYRTRQLYTIWKVFSLTQPIVPDPRYLGRIEELVENRNAISHGRLSAEEVGRRYSRQDLKTRVDDTTVIANYIINSMEAHYRSGGLFISP